MRQKCVLLDGGDTLIRVFPEYDGPMVTWPCLEAVEGAAEVLARLRPAWLTATATNAEQSGEAEIWAALERVGLRDGIDRVYCFKQIGYKKPAPEFFAYILADLELDAEHVVMVGDDYEGDVLGAARSGLRAVWLNERTAERREGARVRTIHSLRELPAVLDSFGLGVKVDE